MNAVLCLALLGGRDGRAVAQSGYKAITVTNGGSISGSVRLAGEVPKNIWLDVSKDANFCGTRKASPRLRISKAHGVQDAIVWIENIAEGKQWTQVRSRLVLEQRGCEYSPHIVLLPFGSPLEIVNRDPVLHNVHTFIGAEAGPTAFNIAQPLKGQRTVLNSTQFKKPGVYLATCDAGHPWMSAYIMVASHPYHALTDEHGNFQLENIPPGEYTLKMWHEGVAIEKTEMQNGRPKAYKYEAPYEMERPVSVSPGKKTLVDFTLVLRGRSDITHVPDNPQKKEDKQ